MPRSGPALRCLPRAIPTRRGDALVHRWLLGLGSVSRALRSDTRTMATTSSFAPAVPVGPWLQLLPGRLSMPCCRAGVRIRRRLFPLVGPADPGCRGRCRPVGYEPREQYGASQQAQRPPPLCLAADHLAPPAVLASIGSVCSVRPCGLVAAPPRVSLATASVPAHARLLPTTLTSHECRGWPPATLLLPTKRQSMVPRRVRHPTAERQSAPHLNSCRCGSW